MANDIVQYTTDSGQDIEVTEQDVRDLLASSGNSADAVTSQEIKSFLRLCQAQRLNPFTRDAYIVKYGKGPATIITGKEAFTKRAFRNPKYKGHRAGITLVGTDGALHRREGSMLLAGESLVGGWCKVFVDGYEAPIYDEVSLSEYSAPDQLGKNGWARMPSTMIRKVSLCHALREAFPEDLGGLYSEEEMSQAAERDIEPISVTSVYEDPLPDPRRDLWRRASALKEEAISAGVADDTISAWMGASIAFPDGAPKGLDHYSADDIRCLISFLEDAIKARREPETESEAELLEAEEIDF